MGRDFAAAHFEYHDVSFEEAMRKYYDFSEGKKNPYADRLKKQVTIRLDEGTIAYFKQMAEETGIPYQTLINLYLRECAQSGRRLDTVWKQGGKSR